MIENATPWRGSISRLVLGIVIVTACALLFIERISPTEVIVTLAETDLKWVLIALLALACGYFSRIIRWWVMIRVAKPTIRFSSCAPPYLISIALNNILPFRAGDIVRVVFFSSKMGISTNLSLISIIIERMVDLAILGFGAGAGLLALKEIGVGAGVFSSLVVLLGVCFLFARFGGRLVRWVDGTSGRDRSIFSRTWFPKLKNILEYLGEMAGHARIILKSGAIINLLLTSVFIWGFEALFYYFLAKSINFNVGYWSSAFIMIMATLSTLIPSLPGYFGVFHFATLSIGVAIGSAPTIAAAYAVLLHSALWGGTTVVGMGFALFNFRYLYSKVSEARENG